MGNLRHRIDDKSRGFLEAVIQHGGKATMTEIRRHTGLNRNEANYRFRKLEDLGLIEIGYAEQSHPRRDPPKVAHLTGKARREIERGLLSKDDGDAKGAVGGDAISMYSPADIRTLEETVVNLEQKVNVILRPYDGADGVETPSDLTERIAQVEQRLDDVETSQRNESGVIEGGSDMAVTELDRRLSLLEEDVMHIDTFVYNWSETAETYLLALRRALTENLEVSMQSYLDAVASEKNQGEIEQRGFAK